MFLTTTIRKTITGIMQSAGGFAEPITRALGLRVRTDAGAITSIDQNDTKGIVYSSNILDLFSVKTVTIQTNLGEPLDADLPDGNRIVFYQLNGNVYAKWKTNGGVIGKEVFIASDAMKQGTTANRPVDPPLLWVYDDTDVGELIVHHGDNVWKTYGGVVV